jgi:hypothetical protein
MNTIHEQIAALTAAGYSLDEILVNDGNEAWGDDCAVTTADAASTRADWLNDGQSVDDLPELPTAREWLAADDTHGIDSTGKRFEYDTHPLPLLNPGLL